MSLLTSNSGLTPKIVLYGNSSSGKTTFAATAADLGNTLLISYKSQPQVVLGNEYKYPLTIYEVKSLNELNDILTWIYLRNGKIEKELKDIDTNFKWIILDGFTQAQYDYGAILARNDLANDDHPVWKPSKYSLTNLSKLEWPQYSDLLNFSNSLTTHLWNMPFPTIVTCLEKDGIVSSLGNGADLLKAGSNILCRSSLKGDKHYLRIKGSNTVEASYRYLGKHDKEVLINSNIRELINESN